MSALLRGESWEMTLRNVKIFARRPHRSESAFKWTTMIVTSFATDRPKEAHIDRDRPGTHLAPCLGFDMARFFVDEGAVSQGSMFEGCVTEGCVPQRLNHIDWIVNSPTMDRSFQTQFSSNFTSTYQTLSKPRNDQHIVLHILRTWSNCECPHTSKLQVIIVTWARRKNWHHLLICAWPWNQFGTPGDNLPKPY